MKNIPYWLDMPYTPRPPLAKSITADVVVVGGGITGVSAAYHSVKAGFKTILVEKDAIASGSAGKNGGMVVEGLAIDFVEACEKFGKTDAIEAWQKTKESREHVAHLIAEHAIDCDFSRPGSLYVASEKKDNEILHRELNERNNAGFSCKEIDQFSPIRKTLWVQDDCVLHPVKFIRGLAHAAEELGLLIYEQTPVESFDEHTVSTGLATIHADKVIIAIESSLSDFSPNIGKIKGEFALVTEPVDTSFLLEWGQGGMFWNTGHDYIAVRKIGSRLFLNGSITFSPTENDLDAARVALIDLFCAFSPRLSKEDIKISHQWTGLLAYPDRHRPFIRQKNGWYELFGNGGTGLTNGIMLGKMTADYFNGIEIPKIYQDF